MIVQLTFTDLFAATYDFVGTGKGIRVWTPKVSPRLTKRPRMQSHGRWPNYTLFDGLDIHHEGIIDGTQAAIMTERQAMLNAVLGDLSAVVGDAKLGTLTVKYLGWTETASADVTIDDYDATLAYDPSTVQAYMFQWAAFLPYFVGDSSGDKYHL